jgi:hypothetical protein
MGGLNWSEGLKAGAVGLNVLAQNKRQETDLLYKQLSQANMQRFQAEQATADRAWRSEESDKTIAARATEGGLDRTSRETISKASIASQAELTKATMEQTGAYQQAMIGDRQTGRQQTGELNSSTIFDRDIERLNEELQAVQNNWESTPEQKAAAQANFDVKVAQAELKQSNPDGFKVYSKIYKDIKPTAPNEMTAANELSMYMSGFDDTEAKKVRDAAKEAYKQLPEKGPNGNAYNRKLAAYNYAIDQHRKNNPDSFDYQGSDAGPQPNIMTPETADGAVNPNQVIPVNNVGAISSPAGGGSDSVASMGANDQAVEGGFIPPEPPVNTSAMARQTGKKQAQINSEAAIMKIKTAKEMKAALNRMTSLTKEQKAEIVQRWYAQREETARQKARPAASPRMGRNR